MCALISIYILSFNLFWYIYNILFVYMLYAVFKTGNSRVQLHYFFSAYFVYIHFFMHIRENTYLIKEKNSIKCMFIKAVGNISIATTAAAYYIAGHAAR